MTACRRDLPSVIGMFFDSTPCASPVASQVEGNTRRFARYHAIFPHAGIGSLPSFKTYRFVSQDHKTDRRHGMAITSSNVPLRRTIRRQQLREMVPLADSTMYEMEHRDKSPRRFALSPRCIVWDLAKVQAWLESRRAAPVKQAKHPDVRQRKTRPIRAPNQARAAS